jgi:exopolysaccharide biosynthesis polyprenyl glycosylphosphotransferase
MEVHWRASNRLGAFHTRQSSDVLIRTRHRRAQRTAKNVAQHVAGCDAQTRGARVMSTLDGGYQTETRGRRGSAARLDTPVPLAAEVLSAAVHSSKPSSAFGMRRLGQRRVLVVLLVAADLFVCVIALRLAQWTYTSPWVPPELQPGPRPSLLANLPLWLAIVFPTLKIRGLYRFRYRDGLYSIGRAATSIVFAGVLYTVLIFFLNLPTYRAFVVLLVAYTLILLVGSRFVFGAMAARLPPLSRRVLVVGSGDIAESTARMVSQYRRRGLYLVSPSLDADEFTGVRAATSQPSALNTNDLERIAAYIRALDVDDVVITRDWYERNCPDVEHAFTMLSQLVAQVHVAPDPPELMMRMSVEDFSGLPVVSLSTLSPSAWQLAVKRVFDLVASTLLIVLAALPMVVIAIAIRVTSPGHAIFKQVRVGRYHRPFVVYKFRTMYEREHSIPAKGPHKQRGDPRVTPIGRFLRRTSLDELPQLFNAFKGNMSLVGPRPELPEIARRYQPWQYGRLMVPPGITGWWQVNGRGERILHEHTEDDIYYVRNFSLLLDAKIILRTLRAIITGRGAF